MEDIKEDINNNNINIDEQKQVKEENSDKINQPEQSEETVKESSEQTDIKADSESEKEHQTIAEKIMKFSKRERIKELENKCNDLNEKYLRLFAEFDNYRKRSLNERMELIKTGSEDMIKILLPIIDDFERALKSIEASSEGSSLKEGINLIYIKFITVLEQKGVKPIKAIGEEFNTDFHEAMAKIDAPSEDLKGKVIDEVVKGYMLNDKVLRYSKVIVGS
ncbi:MAG: nucleotide exchange factor GrpE [Bacteroidales bacterium]|nr:nucleotide exchange factor GrpE [Bacteroidales bacterium]